jgi:hypothetical protein
MHIFRKALPLLLLACCLAAPVLAKKEKKGATEQGLVHRLIGCLANQDAYCYVDLWPDLDTLTALAMKYSDSSSADFQNAYALQQQPLMMMHADSVFQARLRSSFDTLIAAGKKLGIHWDGIVLTHYELIKQRESRNRLYEKLAPTRFVGYIFFMDAATGRNYGLMVGNILNMNGGWWGGELGDVYPATNRDEWQDARFEARKAQRERKDSTAQARPPGEVVPDEDEEHQEKPTETRVTSRTLYSGMFDNEIPVQLYVRGLAGGCPSEACAWEAIYKFGDQDDWVRLDVSKTPDGKWQLTEVPPLATMELELKDKTFTGIWISRDDQTGYDVKLTAQDASAKKISRLDKIFAELKRH